MSQAQILRTANPRDSSNLKDEYLTDKNSSEEEDNFKEKNLSHPAMKYIYGSSIEKKQFLKFSKSLYRALQYSTNSLKGPSEQFIRGMSIALPELADSKQKVLFMDLDETLIHALSIGKTGGNVDFTIYGEKRSVNIRPYCKQFLLNMSQLYNIYVFTAATLEYASPIVDYLNKGKKTISGILHRQNCLITDHNLQIKDLRIVKDRDLSQIIIVDNFVHSFGLQLENGIPILQFRNNKRDEQLKGLQQILIKASKEKDVRKFISKTFQLKKNLDLTEDEFLKINH